MARDSGLDGDLRDRVDYFAEERGLLSLTPALPLSSTKFRLFSSQMYSAMVQLRCLARVRLPMEHGAVKASGSISVVSIVIVSGPVSRKRSATFSFSL